MGYYYYLVCVVGFSLLSSFIVSSTHVHSINTSYWSVLDPTYLNRSSFPDGFIFGAGSAAYQVEGAAFEGGRGPSIWDNFTHEHPEKIADGSNGDVAVDQYHRYEEDVRIMKDMNLDSYRFSISWSRILPKGKLSGGINYDGIHYYHNLLDELELEDIKPFVTLFHWDLPQALEDDYNGFLNSSIIDDFRDYADLCFKEYGHRVKLWVTLNEPQMFSKNGYASGSFAPGRCSNRSSCPSGDSGTEPYIVTHNLLLAHAEAFHLYKTKYQKSQNGSIGITLVSNWCIPLAENSTSDQRAAKRSLDFQYGWYMEPLTTGEYPKSMRRLVRGRLPKFNETEASLVKDSFDFIGLNYYSSAYVTDAPLPTNYTPNYLTDDFTSVSFERDGRPLGLRAASFWIYFYPIGLQELLLYTKENYNNPVIYINENGMSEFNDSSLTVEETLLDTYRIDYHNRHFYYLRSAINAGVKVLGYFAWSFVDDFEWSNGYTIRFGLNFIDRDDGLKRYPKQSAQWYRNFLKRN